MKNYFFFFGHSPHVMLFIVSNLSFFVMTSVQCNKRKLNSNKAVVYYTVKFISNGGNAVKSIRVAAGSKATKPKDPTLTNYEFEGWYSDQSLTKYFDFNTIITDNIKLYAKWALATYTIIFNSNGGSPIPSQKVKALSKGIKPPNPTFIGRIFIGWYLDDTFMKPFNFYTTIVTSNLTLYAQWMPNGLGAILKQGRIPDDLSSYDTMAQQVLEPYPAGTVLSPIYITESGAGRQDGISWNNAYSAIELKKAIDTIQDAHNNKVYLVLIGAGVYTPGQSLSMKNNVAIVGGWPRQGGWTHNASDITVFNGNNDYRVFKNQEINSTALLYGVKIIAGTIYHDNGGGMYNINASPTLTNVIFENNNALDGAGMYNEQNSSPILNNIIFLKNNALGLGGGMANSYHSSPILTNIIFIGNTASLAGGGLSNDMSSPILTNIVFSCNSAISPFDFGGNGGGIYSYNSSSPVVVNAIFWGNTSTRTDPQYTSGGSVNYSVVQDSSRATLSPTNPVLSGLTYTAGYFMPTVSYTGTSPDNLGVYVKRTKTVPYTFYYSTDGNTWYTDPTKIGTGTAATLPAVSSVVDLTATDIQGRPRKGRPNAGVWAK